MCSWFLIHPRNYDMIVLALLPDQTIILRESGKILVDVFFIHREGDSMDQTVAWGILGTGAIAHIFARGVRRSRTGTLVAIGSRTQTTADTFGETWNVPHRYGDYEKVLADPAVQAVYISTPHPFHAEWAMKAAEAGKHILCEKPLALNQNEARAIIEAARRHDVFLMEAFMYRCHPQVSKLTELIRMGTIGQVRLIEATFSFQAEFSPTSRLFNNALGGGGILDVGGYCTSMTRLIAGAALGQKVAEPLQLVAVGHVGATNVDEYTLASLTFPGNIGAQLFAGLQIDGENVVRVFGSEGSLLLTTPWLPRPGEDLSILVSKGRNSPTQQIAIENTQDLYALEADTVATFLTERQAPVMDWNDTLGNMHTLDRWRAALGVVYASEQAEAQKGSTTDFHQERRGNLNAATVQREDQR